MAAVCQHDGKPMSIRIEVLDWRTPKRVFSGDAQVILEGNDGECQASALRRGLTLILESPVAHGSQKR